MMFSTKRVSQAEFDAFLVSKPIVILRVDELDSRAAGWDAGIDTRVEKFFSAEYKDDVAFGCFDVSGIFSYDLWAEKHFGGFPAGHPGYYLGIQGKLVKYHSQERAISKLVSEAPGAYFKQGRIGASLLALGVLAVSEVRLKWEHSLPDSVARSIIEQFESALSKRPSVNQVTHRAS